MSKKGYKHTGKYDENREITTLTKKSSYLIQSIVNIANIRSGTFWVIFDHAIGHIPIMAQSVIVLIMISSIFPIFPCLLVPFFSHLIT